ncbi:hypothetical protein FHS43_005210 [Streptosporangium becharense]|uniref:DUF4276 domain-containing protein n=1 Tax=Streptosporangium becharense TaxID=1816182 RepID=A0A7W9IIN3_9ACTN|nr:hypothetical protein [Streptosporangium becharense]MBB2913901.1 hypothetical protein [Streptosporangium becharense]MBB5821437.1 hypothetical protein [Streptosporangium becharense]
MTPRPLVPGLVAEGEADEGFLGIVISRQLRELTWTSPYAVDVEATEVVSCRREHIVAALEDLAADCHLLFTHRDERERGRADGIRYHSHYLVPVIGLGDTEAWLLADRAVWAGLAGSDPDVLPARPRDVERITDPAAVLAATVPRRGKPPRDYFEYIGRNIDLAVLAQVPAYANWVAETRNALKGLGYL